MADQPLDPSVLREMVKEAGPMTDAEFEWNARHAVAIPPSLASSQVVIDEARRARAAEAKWRALHEEKESHLLDLELARAEAAELRKALAELTECADAFGLELPEGEYKGLGNLRFAIRMAKATLEQFARSALAMNATGGTEPKCTGQRVGRDPLNGDPVEWSIEHRCPCPVHDTNGGRSDE